MGGWALKVLLSESSLRIDNDYQRSFTEAAEVSMYQALKGHTRTLVQVHAAGELQAVGKFLQFYDRGGLTYPTASIAVLVGHLYDKMFILDENPAFISNKTPILEILLDDTSLSVGTADAPGWGRILSNIPKLLDSRGECLKTNWWIRFVTLLMNARIGATVKEQVRDSKNTTGTLLPTPRADATMKGKKKRQRKKTTTK
jgi:hypothetical protein